MVTFLLLLPICTDKAPRLYSSLARRIALGKNILSRIRHRRNKKKIRASSSLIAPRQPVGAQRDGPLPRSLCAGAKWRSGTRKRINGSEGKISRDCADKIYRYAVYARASNANSRVLGKIARGINEPCETERVCVRGWRPISVRARMFYAWEIKRFCLDVFFFICFWLNYTFKHTISASFQDMNMKSKLKES